MKQETIETLNRRLRDVPRPAPLGMYCGKEVYAMSDVLEYWLAIAVEPDTLEAQARDDLLTALLKNSQSIGSDSGLMIYGELSAVQKVAKGMLEAALEIVSNDRDRFPGRSSQIRAAKLELEASART